MSRAKARPIFTPARFNKYGTKSVRENVFFIRWAKGPA
jgi:hypothetical protein